MSNVQTKTSQIRGISKTKTQGHEKWCEHLLILTLQAALTYFHRCDHKHNNQQVFKQCGEAQTGLPLCVQRSQIYLLSFFPFSEL